MKRIILPAILAAVATAAFAQVPQHLNYQGRVSVQGVNFTGTGQFKFALVDAGTPFGDTATATAVLENDAVTAVNVDQTGSHYLTPPEITFNGPGTGATATAVLNLGIVIMINVTNGGSGYTTAPTVTIAPPPAQSLYSSYWSNDGTSSAGDPPTAALPISVTNGLYSVALGSVSSGMTAFPANLFDRPLFLRVWFDDGTHGVQLLTPDQPLAATPYAMRAETVPNGSIGPAQLSEPLARRGPALSYLICMNGVFPSIGENFPSNGEPVLGQIRCVAFTYNMGSSWLPCDGRLLPISNHTALFALIGIRYGGNGTSHFALPDLRNAAPVGNP